MYSFINDKRGISEEFTSLPALMVVMIGFALFFTLLAGVYHAHNERVESIEKYEAANFILEKLTSAEGVLERRGIIREGGVVDKIKFEENANNYGSIIEESGIVGVDFGLKLTYKEGNEIHQIEWSNIPKGKDKIAASKEVAVYLNEAQTVSGVLTVLVWGVE